VKSVDYTVALREEQNLSRATDSEAKPGPSKGQQRVNEEGKGLQKEERKGGKKIRARDVNSTPEGKHGNSSKG